MGSPIAKQTDVRSVFISDLRAKGIAVKQELPDGRFVLTMNGYSVRASIDNVQREYDNTHDAEIVHRFVRGLADGRPADLARERAKPGLLYIEEPSDTETEDSIKAPIAGRVLKVLEYYDPVRKPVTVIAAPSATRSPAAQIA